MSKILFLTCALISLNVVAYEYPDASRDKEHVVKALKAHNIAVEDLRFPLKKQLFTGTAAAITEIPELLPSAPGFGEGPTVTVHTIEGKFNGLTKTCMAYVRLTPDHFSEVEISGCGTNFTNLTSSDMLVPLTKI